MATTRTTLKARKALSRWPGLSRLVKRFGVYPRYWAQSRACRRGYRNCPDYEHKILFVAGLPKSGTTWLEKMLCSYPGFHSLLIPEVAAYELSTGGSHDYELPDDVFSRWKGMLVLTKMHVHGSPHNTSLLRRCGVRYAVLYRDLRDAAVSYCFYVAHTPWHPEYPIYSKLTTEERLHHFARRRLADYADWVRSWRRNRDPELSLMWTYEEMLKDAHLVLTQTARHFGLDSSPATVRRIVDENSFKRLSKGRSQGQEIAGSFFRKGVAGDWRRHLKGRLKEVYKEKIGDFLIETGYEKDLSW